MGYRERGRKSERAADTPAQRRRSRALPPRTARSITRARAQAAPSTAIAAVSELAMRSFFFSLSLLMSFLHGKSSRANRAFFFYSILVRMSVCVFFSFSFSAKFSLYIACGEVEQATFIFCRREFAYFIIALYMLVLYSDVLSFGDCVLLRINF